MFGDIATALGLAFTRVIQGLWDSVSLHVPGAARQFHGTPLAYGIPAATPLLRRIQAHIARLVLRLDSLAQRWESRRLAPPRPSQPRPPRPPRAEPRLPSGHAWLVREVQRTAPFTGQVQVFLDRADTQALVAAAPQAGRIPRPLCHMLGLAPPPWLRLPGTPPPPDPCPLREQRRRRRLDPPPWSKRAAEPAPAPAPAEPPPTPWRWVQE